MPNAYIKSAIRCAQTYFPQEILNVFYCDSPVCRIHLWAQCLMKGCSRVHRLMKGMEHFMLCFLTVFPRSYKAGLCINFSTMTQLSYQLTVFTARCYASAGPAMGLCLSVTSRSSTKTAKRRPRITTRYPRDSSFLTPKISAKFDRGHPLRGRRMQVGWSKSATFDK